MKRKILLVLVCILVAGGLAAGGRKNAGAAPVEDLKIVKIPGGTFYIGPAVVLGDGPEPQPEITLSTFYMCTLPVLQNEYEKVMGINPSLLKDEESPVEMVTWFDAIKYCNQVSLLEGLTPVYTIEGTDVIWTRNANGYRLPTEAEWEYAARAGASTTFPPDGLHPWGLYDIPCGIWEWCWDWYNRYQDGKFTDPTGPENGKTRVLRAGTSFHSPRSEMIRLRSHGAPDGYGLAIGFRMVRNSI